jgi:predicted HAD superfamily Cof-like phosphohydrolase
LLDKIQEMHTKFQITNSEIPFTQEEKDFRIRAMQEELDEYEEASTLEDELDALVDLCVFAFGTAERMNLLGVFEEAYNRVMQANLQKELGTNEKRGSFEIDLVKPDGWQSPILTDLVEGI